MQSYLDVSLILVMAVAVFILTLMLIFFLTLSRRIKKLTLENQKLKNALDKEIIENKTRNEDYLKNIENLDRKIRASDLSLQYLSSNQQDLVDRQKMINSSFDNLSVKVEQQKKEIEDKTTENQPIIVAKRYLAEGMSIEEVVKKTGIPQYEVEMLAKVHRLTEKLEKNELPQSESAAKVKSTENTKIIETPVAPSNRNTVEPAAEPPKVKPQSTPQSHVASLKAREAYGIASKNGLRRPR
jgi:hypothetical protein